MAASEQLAIDFAPDVSPQNPNTDELPDGWRVARLDQVCEINPSRKGRTNYPDDLPVTFVSMSAVDEDAGTIAVPEVRPFSEVKKGYTWFIENDVLFAKISPCMQNGKAAVARGLSNGVGFGSTEFHVLRPGPDVLPEWVHLFIRQPSFRAAAARHFTGSVGQQRVPESVVGIQVIPVPPLPEQRRIVTRIEELAAKIEQARGLRREAAREVGAIQDSAASLVLRDRADAELVAIDTVADVRGGIQKGPHRTAENNPVRYLTVAHVQRNRISLADPRHFEVNAEELDRWRLEQGDVLMIEGNGSANEIGRTALFRGELQDCVHQNHVIRIRSDQKRIDPEFLNAYLNSPVGRDEVQGQSQSTSGLRTLSVNRIKQIKVPLFSLQEQRSVMMYLDSVQSKADVLKQLQTESAAELDALLPAVLARAFRGEL